MYKVLLADDEKVILHGISTLVDWEKLGTRLIGTALDGEMALEMIEREPPDIVISDIKMPGMDGLRLSGKCANVIRTFALSFCRGTNSLILPSRRWNTGSSIICSNRAMSEKLPMSLHRLLPN